MGSVVLYVFELLCVELDRAPAGVEDICRVVCFPRRSYECCVKRLEELAGLGIEGVYSFGDVVLDSGVRVVGKGHAALVVLARHAEHGYVALKVRRTDSKRFSMELEARFLSAASGTGYTPKLYGFSENFLVREYIDGCTLDKLFKVLGGGDRIVRALENLIRAAYAVDSIGIDLVEVSKPIKQVVYLCCSPEKPFFIDFESARYTPRPLNVTKVIGFIIAGSIGGARVRDFIGLGDEWAAKLLDLARSYKETGDNKARSRIVEEAVKVLWRGF